MKVETNVVIFDGPLTWFHEQIDEHSPESFFLIVSSDDAIRRALREDQSSEYEDLDHVAAESTDFASLTESAISNFAGLVRRYRPKNLYLHNPPTLVRDQLRRLIPDLETRAYEYPGFTRDTLRDLDREFGTRLVGQARARDKILAALYSLTSRDRRKPYVAMLYGPSGVGKTETALLLSELAKGTLLRSQFSMFNSEKFGSYVFGGSHSEPSLAHDLLNRESNVVLLDEFDKAHRGVYSAFFQLFDGGEFVDKNYSVVVGPALILCTSNFESEEDVQEALGDALFSRFDAVIGYEQLTPDEAAEVIRRVVERSVAKLTPEELRIINPGRLLRRLQPLARHPGNARRLQKHIDEFISRTLARAFMDGRLSPPAE